MSDIVYIYSISIVGWVVERNSNYKTFVRVHITVVNGLIRLPGLVYLLTAVLLITNPNLIQMSSLNWGKLFY